MKFQLFGRLRGDDNSSDTSGPDSTDSSYESGPGGLGSTDTSPQPMSSGLEKTVENMFNQGYSEEEIRQELQGQYSGREIQDAVSQVVKSQASGVSDGPEAMSPYNGGDKNMSPMDEGFNQQEQNNNNNFNSAPAEPQNQPHQPSNPEPIPAQGQGNNESQSNATSPQIEELVETIVAENFEKVEKEFENAYSEIDELKEKLDDLDQRVHDLEVRDDEDQTQFIQKMDDIEEDINAYQSRIGGLEKAFQQVLPSLVDNVRELTSLVQEIKQEKGIETETTVSEDNIQSMDEW